MNKLHARYTVIWPKPGLGGSLSTPTSQLECLTGALTGERRSVQHPLDDCFCFAQRSAHIALIGEPEHRNPDQ